MSHGPLVDSIMREEEEKGWKAVLDMSPPQRPLVCTAVIVKRYGQILLGKRIKPNVSGFGLMSCPGGHLEYGESFVQAAGRELAEETGIKLIAAEQLAVVNSVYVQDGRHFVVVFMGATLASGEPVNVEPHKCAGWEWTEPNKYPDEQIMPGIAKIRALGALDNMKDTIFISPSEAEGQELIDVDEVRRYHEKARRAGIE